MAYSLRLSVAASLLVLATSLAGCAVEPDDASEADEATAVESELATNEVVAKGTVLRVTYSAGLNVRASGSTSARIVAALRFNDRVTAITTSGSTGWVNIRTASGVQGWVFGRYVERVSTSTSTPSGATCAPSRGQGVVGRYQKALHDAIAYAEGTRGYSMDGYNVLFSYRTVSSCNRHPNLCLAFGSTCSTAAGRYQFLTSTWNGVARARGLTTFEPENQERGAAYLISNVRRVTVPQTRPMTATEFSNAMAKLSYEWASLPPGRYGQPVKTLSQMRSTYCRAAGC
jgi:muramidase (phage lysozyme)